MPIKKKMGPGFKIGLGLLIAGILSLLHVFLNVAKLESNNRHESIGRRQLQKANDLWKIDTFEDFGEYSVSWSIDLEGKDFLLKSDFLKAGLEYSAKTFINRQLACEDGFEDGVSDTSFFKVRINDEDSLNKIKRISGSGKCRGNATRCKKRIKQSVSDAGKKNNLQKKTNGGCGTSIFELFQNTLIKASYFNYNVTLDLINDFSGNIALDLDVNFEESNGDGLDQIDSVSFEAADPIEILVDCDTRCEIQREEQRSTVIGIFDHFEIPFEIELHECLFVGINCNDQDLVTYIWLGHDRTYDLRGKTLPQAIFNLPSLEGLFLGGNELVGTIPSDIGKSNSDLRLLWLEGNSLSGQIPTLLGNLPLRELNIHGNELTGPLPSELGKLSKLRLLNLGQNKITGTIPSDFFDGGSERGIGAIDPCRIYRNIVKKLRLTWNSSLQIQASSIPLQALQILSLHDNLLTGSIPPQITSLKQLVELSLAGNNLAGDLPSKIGSMKQLQALDLHNNDFSGLIPEGIGNMQNLKVLNLYNNRLEKTIPTTIGLLRQLKELILDKNKLSGSIPTEVGKLTKPDFISFSGNKMSGQIPTELGNLASLKNLDIRDYAVVSQDENKMITSALPSELGNLRRWKYVVFRKNKLHGTVPTEIGKLVAAEAIWLKNEKLSGSIPSNIGNLRTLSLLYLRNSSFIGAIPASIGILENLETLDIAMNGLTGEVPQEIGVLSRLKHINVGKNRMNGDVLSHLTTVSRNLRQASSLEYLNIESNEFTGVIPTSLGSLTQLKSLTAGTNSLVGTLPREVGNLKSLNHFDLGSNDLTGSIPTEFGKIDTLKDIGFGGNALTGPIPSELGLVSNLESIDLGSNDLTGPIPSEFGQIDTLKDIGLGSNALTGSIPSELGLLSSLESIDLGSNSLTGPIPSEFGQIDTLKNIGLGNNALTGPIPSELGLISSLESIDLGSNNLIGFIPSEFGEVDSLQHISLGDNQLTGSIPAEMGSLAFLVSLDLSSNRLTGTVPNEFGDLDSLLSIEIGSNNVTPQRFMCSLQSLDKNFSDILNCLNYCGTTDEECTKDSLRGATCLHVGCNGSPQCTNNCRLDYSLCETSEEEMTFQLNLQTVDKGYETKWEIRDGSNSIWNFDSSYRNFDSFISEFRCLERGCYEFELFDEGNDGICCSADDLNYGNYSVLIDGDIIVGSDPNFGSSITHLVGNCSIPTKSPLQMPSLVPERPSNNPSMIPSSLPSYNPSSNPSMLPSSLSSYSPSSNASMTPSFSSSYNPTTNPTQYPSFMPTRNILPILNTTSWDSQCRTLTFRVAENLWDGKLSTSNQIGVSGGGWNKVHLELTSRILNDGETFIIVGTKYQVGVGLCIDSCNLESDFGVRWHYNCVGFYGNRAEMIAADINDVEYTIPVDKPNSKTQGFTYNRTNNCVTHIGSSSQSCTQLPSHFSGKAVRAIGQVWNSASATISSTGRRLMVPNYNTTSWNSQCDDITFRTAENTWNGRWSNSTQIGIAGRPADKIHKELTSRRLNDGELFNVSGSSNYIAVGLCIESCDLESTFGIRGKHDCVGFYGNETLMWATDATGSEYSVSVVNSPSNILGYTYDQVNNCVTHINSINGACTSLPLHFDEQSIRAVVQVWNNSIADLV